jgi:sugar/nucleoside kinase (ribokinase family)
MIVDCKKSCVIIGDVNIDIFTDLSDIMTIGASMSDACYFKTIRNAVGGNGVFFAESALEAGFFNAYLVGCIGTTIGDQPDMDGQAVLDRLEKTRVIPRFAFSNAAQTGKVIMIYQENDKRLLIADRGANRHLTEDNMPDLDPICLNSRLVYVSGYMMAEHKQRLVVTKAIERFRTSKCVAFLDVVPHDLYLSISLMELKHWLASFSGFAFELPTITGFLGEDTETRAISRFKKEILMPNQFALIRLNGKSDFLICDTENEKKVFIPYVDRFASLRFTDRVIAHCLYSYLQSDFNLFDHLEWVEKITRLLTSQNQS